MQDTNAMVSVIVPVYNVEAYLRQCLDSLIGQSYQALEIILVNDGSTDRSGAICDEYARIDSRVRVIHVENGGQSRARNIALDQARGEYISYVDSDDWLEPETYAELVSIMDAHKHWGLLKFGVIRKPKHERRRGSHRLREYTGLRGHLLSRGGNLLCNALYRHEAIRDIRFMEGYYCEDVHYTASILAQGEMPFGICARRYYHYRTSRPDSTTNSKGLRLSLDTLALYEDLLKRITEHRPMLYLCLYDTLRAVEHGMLKAYKRGRLSPEELATIAERISLLTAQVPVSELPSLWQRFGLMIYIKAPQLYWLAKRPTAYMTCRKYLRHS